MDHSLRRLYEDLRSIAVAVVYPPGEDRDLLVEQLKRIGCRIHLHWPFPDCPPAGADVVFFLVSQCGQNSAAWSSSEADATLIALSDYETPTTLKQLLKTNAHGVLTRPFRSAGILSTLVLARSAKLFQNRQQNKIDKLEGTIKARRVIEKAIRALMDNQRVDEREAYEHMRSRATRLRVSVAEVAAMIVEASEAMEKLGLGGASARAPGTAEKPRETPHESPDRAHEPRDQHVLAGAHAAVRLRQRRPDLRRRRLRREQGQAHRHVRLHRPGRSARRRAGHAGVGHGLPSGRVDGAAYRELCDRIVAAAPGCDALLLDLHGAMAVETTDDGEGDLLERLRRAAPGVPVAVALDLHGNVTQKMVDNADVIISFKTYPHVDMYETGEHAGRILFDWLAGGPRPALAWRRLPLMTHTLRSATAEGAMREAVQAARQAEQGAVLGVSVLAGFALADIPAPCLSVVAVGAGEAGRAAAERAVTALADAIWANRDGFYYRSEPLADSLARAARLAEGANKPVLLLDHGDNCMSGGTCDTMDVLMAALDAGLTGIQAGLYCDPEAVAAMARAGLGATVELPVGNKRPIDAIGRAAAPVTLRGVVRALTNGEYVITGPTYTGQTACMGPSAVLDLGAAQLVLTSRTHEPWDLGVFESLGLDPRAARFVLVKSRMYCRPVFVPISGALVECDSPGVTSSDYGLFAYQRRQRPLYPLEPMAQQDYRAQA